MFLFVPDYFQSNELCIHVILLLFVYDLSDLAENKDQKEIYTLFRMKLQHFH